jgi:hypothetical protein
MVEIVTVDGDDDDAFCDVMPYSLVNIYQNFEGSLCLQLHCQEVQELPYNPSKLR